MFSKRLILFVFFGLVGFAGCDSGGGAPATADVPKGAPATPEGQGAAPAGAAAQGEAKAASAVAVEGGAVGESPEAVKEAADPAAGQAAVDPAAPSAEGEGVVQGDQAPVGILSDSKEITFKRALPKIGAVMTEVTGSDMLMDMRLTILGTPKDMKSEEKSKERRLVTALAASPEAITKVKVRYEEKAKLQKQNGEGKPEQVAPVVGKTYTVEAKEGALVVLDEAGKPISPDELRIIEGDFEGFGQRDEFAALLPSAPMKVGDKLDLTVEVIKQLIKVGQEMMEFSEVSFVLKEVRDIGGQMAGVFELLMKIEVKPGPGMSIQMAMKGEVVIRAEGWLSSFAIEGPITVVADKSLEDKMKIDGSGRVKFLKTVAY